MAQLPSQAQSLVPTWSISASPSSMLAPTCKLHGPGLPRQPELALREGSICSYTYSDGQGQGKIQVLEDQWPEVGIREKLGTRLVLTLTLGVLEDVF